MINLIDSGKVISSGSYDINEKNLIDQNINLYILKLIDQYSCLFDEGIAALELLPSDKTSRYNKLLDNGNKVLGGNAVASAMAVCLSGGTKALSNHEDMDWSSRLTSLFYKSLHDRDIMLDDLRPLTSDSVGNVEVDNDIYIRLANLSQPITEIWDIHDNRFANMPVLDLEDKNLNKERIEAEINNLFQVKSQEYQEALMKIFIKHNFDIQKEQELIEYALNNFEENKFDFVSKIFKHLREGKDLSPDKTSSDRLKLEIQDVFSDTLYNSIFNNQQN